MPITLLGDFMSKTVSVSEAKAKLSAMMEWTVTNQDEVIIENRGKPTAVLLPFSKYKEYRQTQKQAAREELLARLQRIAVEVQQKNLDLTQEETEVLAEEVSQETIQNLVKKGKVQFEE